MNAVVGFTRAYEESSERLGFCALAAAEGGGCTPGPGADLIGATGQADFECEHGRLAGDECPSPIVKYLDGSSVQSWTSDHPCGCWPSEQITVERLTEPTSLHHATPTAALVHVTSSPVVATPARVAAIPSEERASLDGARADQPAGAPPSAHMIATLVEMNGRLSSDCAPNLMSTFHTQEAVVPETTVPSSLEKARAVRSEKAAARRAKLDHLEAERATMEADGVDFPRLTEMRHTLRVLGESSKDPRIAKLERWLERQVLGDPEPPAAAQPCEDDPIEVIADQLGERLSQAEVVRDQLDERLSDLQDQIDEVSRMHSAADARFERLERAKLAIDELLAHDTLPVAA